MSSSNVIGIPEREGDFERHCRVLFAEMINDPHTKLVGTRGKNQGGFDIIGSRDGDPEQPVGIQCKNKPKGGRLDLKEVRSDIIRMLEFTPPVTEIYVATTASDDLTYDKLALEMRQEQKQLGRKVNIQIWGFDTLTDHILRSPAALRAFDPNYSASTNELIEGKDELLGINRQQLENDREILSAIQGFGTQVQQMIAPVDIDAGTVDEVLNKQLDNIRALLNDGRPKAALALLEAMDKEGSAYSPAIRSRISGNMGFAEMRLGNLSRAGDLLMAAYELNPTDPKARANRILGLTLKGEIQEAFDYGRDLLKDDPTNAPAVSFLYQAAALAGNDLRPDEVVPEAMRNDENAGITRAAYLRKHGQTGEWRNWVADRAAAIPNSAILRRFHAEATLDDLYERRAFGPEDAEGLDRAALKGAAAELQSLWDEWRKHDDAEQAGTLWIAHNLITAYRALRDLDAADRVAEQALAIAPDDPDLKIATAHIDIISGRASKAVEKLIGLSDTPGRTMALVTAYVHLRGWSEVLALATPDRVSLLKGLDRQGVDCMVLHARLELGEFADPGHALETLAATWPDELHVIVTAAELTDPYAPDRFDGLFAKAMDRARTAVPMIDRLMLAQLAIERDRFADAITVLDGYVPTDTPSEPLAMLLLAFANAPTQPRTREFIQTLPASVQSDGRMARLAGAAEYNRGDLRSAERHLRAAIRANAGDLRSQLMLHGTLLRDGRPDAAATQILAVDEQGLSGSAIDRMRLAGALRRAGAAERSLTLGFDVAVHNRDDEQVSAAYPTLLFMSEDPIPRIEIDQGARESFWLRLEGGGASDIEGLLTSSVIPGALNFDADHPVSLAVMGKKLGDEIVLPSALGIERRYVLRELKHKWVWLSHCILSDHNARFPASTGFVEMKMQDENVAPVLDVVRKSEDHNRSVSDLHVKTGLPLAIAALIGGKDVVGLAHRIALQGEFIRTCVGLHSERERAQRVASKARGKGVVLDTITAVTAEGLELLPALKDYFGRVVISRGTMDELTHLSELQSLNSGRETMQIGFEGDQAVRHIQSPEDNARQLARIGKLIQTVREHCEVLTADGHPSPLDDQLVSVAGLGEALDPIRIADREKLALLSDDMPFRLIAETGGVRAHTWLQATALNLRDAKVISPEDYALTTARLAALRHGYVTVDARSLSLLVGGQGEDNDTLFDAAGGAIGGPQANIVSHAEVVAAFACLVWSRPVASWRKQRALGKLLENLLKDRLNDTKLILDFIRVDLRKAGRGGRPDLGQEYLAEWRKLHFIDAQLPPPDRRGGSKGKKGHRKR